MCGSRPETAGGRIRAGHLHTAAPKVGRLMAGHTEPTALPAEVIALLGADPLEHTGAGACRVLSGGGLVAKIGPPEIVAREAAVLRLALPLRVPSLVDAGPGWLVTAAEADDDRPWAEDELHDALADLAHLHDSFEDAVPSVPSLRRPFSADGARRLLDPVRRLGPELPAPLAALLADPSPLLTAAAAEPPTLLHGDPWPRNILRPSPGQRVWVDWEMASVGPAAADVASWLNQTPWHTGTSTEGHLEVYLAARRRPVDRARFRRALDAAAVLWSLAYDVPHLAAGGGDAAPRSSSPADDGSARPISWWRS